ncbi:MULTISPECIES: hypothetical protein [unclassified Streptomyces]|uniref:hypothetical protein n=1 Tax=unclassified Streptomyces TaxID=2593676 RepID=UPI00380742BA
MTGDAGVLGTALAVVLAFSLAQGSWEWFSTYLGVTLLAVVLSFGHVPVWTPDRRAAYGWSLAAFSLVVGLCVALTLAPALQRWDWLFPMPGTRHECVESGRYESLRTQAALGNLAGRDSDALAHTQLMQSRQAVADCLASTTTRWLPVYALGTALLGGCGFVVMGAGAGAGPEGGGRFRLNRRRLPVRCSSPRSQPLSRWR